MARHLRSFPWRPVPYAVGLAVLLPFFVVAESSGLERSEAVLQAMDDIYSMLVTMDFPDALTGGLRRQTDIVRGVLEKTRGDLTVAWRQDKLEKRMKDFEDKVS